MAPKQDPLADVSRETRHRLEIFVETLERWQKAINLVSRNTMDGVWKRHILDSAQVVPLIPSTAETLADLGSGGGFPGLVIAAMRPDLRITLIESDARKAAFLGEVGRRMGLENQPKIAISRIEVAPPAAADIVTARALAPMKQLLHWAQRHRKDTAICLFHKGKGWQAEVEEAKKEWDFSPEPIASVTDRDAVILRIGPYRAATSGAPSGS
ncbi:MAG: 16S rRNA (guanine(527)-N(7))-methyltransferase RsmG [Alphaproteobacteria bacterium]|jgi:16S rRNA (guanine527-N7)-methyltransferase|nr:16S rRNA (guanine(527)-N(7))-methyltransferase RsmG [Alphaproteobacteria bacterium]